MPRMHVLSLVVFILSVAARDAAGQALPKPLVTGLKNPESVAVGADGRVYVTVIGEFDKDGDGAVDGRRGRQGRAVRHRPRRPQGHRRRPRSGCSSPTRRASGGSTARARPTCSPRPRPSPSPPLFLNDVVVDPESGTAVRQRLRRPRGQGRGRLPHRPQGAEGHARRRRQADRRACTRPTAWRWTARRTCSSLDFGTGELHRVKIADGTAEKVADGFERRRRPGLGPLRPAVRQRLEERQGVRHRPAGREAGAAGRGLQGGGRHRASTRPASAPRPRHEGRHAHRGARRTIPGCEVDETPLPLETEVAFPEPASGPAGSRETDSGKVDPAAADRADARRRRQQPRLRRHAARRHPRLPQRPEGDQDEGLPRHPGPRAATTTSRTRRASSAWRSTRSTRRTASSSSSTPTEEARS